MADRKQDIFGKKTTFYFNLEEKAAFHISQSSSKQTPKKGTKFRVI